MCSQAEVKFSPFRVDPISKGLGVKESNKDITKTCLFKYEYNENVTTKNEKFQIKMFDIFHISAQNIDLGTR